MTRGCELFQMGSFSRRCGVPLPCTIRFGRFRMLFSRSLPRQHSSADRSKISFAFSNDAGFTLICCSNECAMSNDSQSSPRLFHHFCSREILSGSYSFHAVGLVQEGGTVRAFACRRSIAGDKRYARMDGYRRFMARPRTAHAIGGDV